MVLDHDHVQQVEAKVKIDVRRLNNKKVLLDLRDVSPAGDAGRSSFGLRKLFFVKTGTILPIWKGRKCLSRPSRLTRARHLNATSAAGGAGQPRDLRVRVSWLRLHWRTTSVADLVGEKTFGEGAQQKTV